MELRNLSFLTMSFYISPGASYLLLMQNMHVWAGTDLQFQILGTAEAYFVWHIGPNFQISLIYAFIRCP